MRHITEYRLQVILGLIQIAIICLGVLSTSAMIKMRTANAFGKFVPIISPLGQFVRDWGVSIMIIPIVWTTATVWLEQRPEGRFGRKATFASGIVTIAALLFFFLLSVTFAVRFGLLQSAQP